MSNLLYSSSNPTTTTCLLVYRATNDGCEAIDSIIAEDYASMTFPRCSQGVGVCCDGGYRF